MQRQPEVKLVLPGLQVLQVGRQAIGLPVSSFHLSMLLISGTVSARASARDARLLGAISLQRSAGNNSWRNAVAEGLAC